MAASSVRSSKGRSQAGITEAELKQQSQELGKVGSYFGSKDNAAIYFAGMLAFVAVIGAILVGVFASAFPEKGDLVKSLVALSVSALSFIGGVSGRAR
ncbi:hypothetical protein R1A27_04805 [Methylobacterium sp. NMS12]|uniref:hypothetical protein n=1 Tax=Methylobacterium sp. NMS12 TaxID=3079766 RepID=UPI003F883D76